MGILYRINKIIELYYADEAQGSKSAEELSQDINELIADEIVMVGGVAECADVYAVKEIGVPFIFS